MNKNTIITVLAVIILILLGVIASQSNKSEETSMPDEGGGSLEGQGPYPMDMGMADDFDITDIGASDGGDAGLLPGRTQGEGLAQSIIEGEDVYSFDGISFIFQEIFREDPSGIPQIIVRMGLDGFRRNNIPIDLATFRLGTYQGNCEKVDSLNTNSQPGVPLAFAQCWWAGQGNQIAVFQKAETIMVRARKISAESSSLQPLQELISFDITELIQ